MNQSIDDETPCLNSTSGIMGPLPSTTHSFEIEIMGKEGKEFLSPSPIQTNSWFYIFLLVMGFICLSANICVLITTCSSPALRRPVNYLIHNLTVGSIVYIIFGLLTISQELINPFPSGPMTCRVLSVCYRLPVPLLTFTIMTLILDRSRLGRNLNPMLSSPTSTSILIKIALIWILSVLFLIPHAFTRQYKPSKESHSTVSTCRRTVLMGWMELHVLYKFIFLLIVHIIPAAIILRDLILIQRRVQFIDRIENRHDPYPTESKRLLRNSRIFSLIFIIFWLPAGILQFPLDLPTTLIPEHILTIVTVYGKYWRVVIYFTVCFNPVLLFTLSRDLRNQSCCFRS